MKGLIARALPYSSLVFASRPHHTAARARKAYNETGIAFIHIPKNAGTSVEIALYGQRLGHRTWSEIRALAPDQFPKWKKWAVVRDPVDRFISAYDYLKGGGRNAWDKEFSRRFLAEKSINDFVTNFPKTALCWFHFRPQADYLMSKGKFVADRVVTMKNLSDLPIDLNHLNRPAGPKTGRSELEIEAIARILEIYAEDVDLFRRVEAREAGSTLLK